VVAAFVLAVDKPKATSASADPAPAAVTFCRGWAVVYYMMSNTDVTALGGTEDS